MLACERCISTAGIGAAAQPASPRAASDISNVFMVGWPLVKFGFVASATRQAVIVRDPHRPLVHLPGQSRDGSESGHLQPWPLSATDALSQNEGRCIHFDASPGVHRWVLLFPARWLRDLRTDRQSASALTRASQTNATRRTMSCSSGARLSRRRPTTS